MGATGVSLPVWWEDWSWKSWKMQERFNFISIRFIRIRSPFEYPALVGCKGCTELLKVSCVPDYRSYFPKRSYLSLPRSDYRRLRCVSLALLASSLHHWLHMLRLALACTAGSWRRHHVVCYHRKSINTESTLWSRAFRFRYSPRGLHRLLRGLCFTCLARWEGKSRLKLRCFTPF